MQLRNLGQPFLDSADFLLKAVEFGLHCRGVVAEIIDTGSEDQAPFRTPLDTDSDCRLILVLVVAALYKVVLCGHEIAVGSSPAAVFLLVVFVFDQCRNRQIGQQVLTL